MSLVSDNISLFSLVQLHQNDKTSNKKCPIVSGGVTEKMSNRIYIFALRKNRARFGKTFRLRHYFDSNIWHNHHNFDHLPTFLLTYKTDTIAIFISYPAPRFLNADREHRSCALSATLTLILGSLAAAPPGLILTQKTPSSALSSGFPGCPLIPPCNVSFM